MLTFDPKRDPYGPDVPIWEKGQMGGRTRLLDRTILLENVRAVRDVFNELHIRHCLSHGTALGVYRDGDAIAWDDDADLALFEEDRPKFPEARRRLRELGFYVPDEGDPKKPVDPKSNSPYFDLVAIRNGEKVEGWIFEKVGQYYVYDQAREGLTIPAEHFDRFSVVNWRGQLFNAPASIEKFLTLMYGPTWKTPDKDRKYTNLRVSDFEGR